MGIADDPGQRADRPFGRGVGRNRAGHRRRRARHREFGRHPVEAEERRQHRFRLAGNGLSQLGAPPSNSSPRRIGGTKMLITASTSSAASAPPGRRRNRPGWRPPRRPPAGPAAGRPRPAHRLPALPARWNGPPPATRLPAGSGWVVSNSATSNSSARLAVRITPDASNSACTLASGTSTEVCCKPATIEPRPLLTATIGLRRANLPGDPGELARVAETLQVQQGQLGRRVGFPVLQQVIAGHVGPVAGRDEAGHAQPAPGRLAEHRHPNAPDWQKNPARPGSGATVASEAFSATRIGVEHARGSSARPPACRARGLRPPARAAPPARAGACSSPDSPKPADITTRPCTPRAPHWPTTSLTSAAGTASTARSTSPGMSAMLG